MYVVECCEQEASKHRVAMDDLKVLESQHKQLLATVEVCIVFAL